MNILFIAHVQSRTTIENTFMNNLCTRIRNFTYMTKIINF